MSEKTNTNGANGAEDEKDKGKDQGGVNKSSSNENVTLSTESLNKLMSMIGQVTINNPDKDNKDNKGNDDPISNYAKKQEELKQATQQQEYLVNIYAEVKTAFAKAYGGEAEGYFKQLDHVSALEDKINFLAKGVISKAYKDDIQVKALLESKTQSVTNKESALYLRYLDAVSMLEKAQSSKVSAFYGSTKKVFNIEELKELQFKIFDYRTRGRAIQQAKDYGFIENKPQIV